MDKYVPRGIRNNNPLNIRIGNTWIGEVEHPTDKEFEQFESMEYGLRAGFILLHRYINRYGLRTITDIISRWAPSNENNTQNYIRIVSQLTGIGCLDPISWENRAAMCSLVDAMVRVECGQMIPWSLISQGYSLAVMATKKNV